MAPARSKNPRAVFWIPSVDRHQSLLEQRFGVLGIVCQEAVEEPVSGVPVSAVLGSDGGDAQIALRRPRTGFGKRESVVETTFIESATRLRGAALPQRDTHHQSTDQDRRREADVEEDLEVRQSCSLLGSRASGVEPLLDSLTNELDTVPPELREDGQRQDFRGQPLGLR